VTFIEEKNEFRPTACGSAAFSWLRQKASDADTMPYI
jgi:hypothetical protein